MHEMKESLSIARQGKVVGTAMRFALIVGPVLVLINHGDSIFEGTMSHTDWAKSALTMFVPYIVSTLSSISAYRQCKSDQ